MNPFVEASLIGAGGFAGAIVRHVISAVLNSEQWPTGTMVANLVAAFILGLLSTRLAKSPTWGPFVLVGFLGSMSTFSTLVHEAIDRNHKGEHGQGRSVFVNIAYLVSSVLLGVLVSFAGEKLGSL